MKILYFTSVDINDHTAPAVRVWSTCKAFKQLGHSVALVHPSGSGSPEAKRLGLDIELAIPWPNFRGGARIFDILAARRLLDIHRKWRPDFVYARCGPGTAVQYALKHINAPKAFELNGVEKINDKRFKYFIDIFDLIMTDGIKMNEYIENIYPLLNKKLRDSEIMVTDCDIFFPGNRMENCELVECDPLKFRIIHVSSFQNGMILIQYLALLTD